MFDRVWVFGDSYAAPGFCVEPRDSFWGLTAQYLGAKSVKNCAEGGNSWRTIMHLVVSQQKQYDWKNDFLLIGISHLERITVFDQFQDTAYRGTEYSTSGWTSEEFDIPEHRGLECKNNYGEDRQMIIWSDRAWTETQALEDLFLLTHWLDSLGANYIVANLTKPLDENNIWKPSSFVLPYALTHPRCILFENTYHSINDGIFLPADYDLYGEFGHHGAEGNRRFFDFSIKYKLQQLGYQNEMV